MTKKIIHTDNAPKAVGAYSQAIESNGFVFISGQIAINPEVGKIDKNDIEGQTHQCLKNLQAILTEAGLTFNNLVKVSIFLDDINNFSKVNEIYASYIGDSKPARACMQVAHLPLNALVEIEAIASNN